MFVCCLSEGNKGKARVLNKWNYGTSAVQLSGCWPSQLLSPHTYLAHISSVPCPIYKFRISLHQLIFLPCLALHAKRICAKRNVAWQSWIRGSRNMDGLWSLWDIRRDTAVGCWRGEEEITDSQVSAWIPGSTFKHKTAWEWEHVLKGFVSVDYYCLCLMIISIYFNFQCIYSDAFCFPALERNDCWYLYNPVR